MKDVPWDGVSKPVDSEVSVLDFTPMKSILNFEQKIHNDESLKTIETYISLRYPVDSLVESCLWSA